MRLRPPEALLRTRRPTFSECVKAIRQGAGDKRRFTEEIGPDEIKFKFSLAERTRYNRAFNELAKLNPVYGEQYLYDEQRYQIIIHRRACVHCKQPLSTHVKGQCLFQATKYKETTDNP
jgi:hypothetical protein